MRAAPSFDTEAYTGVTDEQISLLQARCIHMRAPYVSSYGINRILLVGDFEQLRHFYTYFCVAHQSQKAFFEFAISRFIEPFRRHALLHD